MKRYLTYIIAAFTLLLFSFPILSEGTEKTAPQEEKEKSVEASAQRISLDLKGIDIIELFRILSLKMGVTMVPSKNVSGRINVFLNNLTFEDTLDVILSSQDLACERSVGIISIMTSDEYEKLYGRKYNEKRKFTSYKLTYAKPSTVFNALSQVKSDVGKIIMDETSGTIFLLDTPERLQIMKKSIKDMDKPPSTEVFDLHYAKAEDIKSHLSSVITPGAGELFVDARSTKVVVSDLPEKMAKIKKIINAFDAETPEVFIDTRIVEITLKDEFQRQINWETILYNLAKHFSQMQTFGTFPVAPSFSVSPSLSAANLQVTVGTLATDDFTSAFQVLQTLGNTRIISQPKIMALNNQEAKIMVGSREAYVI